MRKIKKPLFVTKEMREKKGFNKEQIKGIENMKERE